MLPFSSSLYVASFRPVTWSTGLLVIDTEVGVIGEKVELVSESFDHGAGEILRPRQRKIVERLVDDCTDYYYRYLPARLRSKF
jgi:hypothetical protein